MTGDDQRGRQRRAPGRTGGVRNRPAARGRRRDAAAGGLPEPVLGLLNRRDFDFLPLTNVEITSLADGKVSERPFMVLSKRHIRIAYPYDALSAAAGGVRRWRAAPGRRLA